MQVDAIIITFHLDKTNVGENQLIIFFRNHKREIKSYSFLGYDRAFSSVFSNIRM